MKQKPLIHEWLFLFVQKISSAHLNYSCYLEGMEGEKCSCLKEPEVKFQLVGRKLSRAQAEAGKRLFKRLVARAQLRDRDI